MSLLALVMLQRVPFLVVPLHRAVDAIALPDTYNRPLDLSQKRVPQYLSGCRASHKAKQHEETPTQLDEPRRPAGAEAGNTQTSTETRTCQEK